MKYYSIIFSCAVILLSLTSCEKDQITSPRNGTIVQPYLPGVSEVDVSDDIAKVFVVAHNMEFSSSRPSLSVQGSFFDQNRNAVGYESLSINGVEIHQNIENPAPGVDPKGKFFHQFYDGESAETQDSYDGIYELFDSASGVEIKVNSQEFGNISTVIKTPVLKNVDLSHNYRENDSESILYAKAGIKITWDTDLISPNQRDPITGDVAVVVTYYPERTERYFEDIGEPDVFDNNYPQESMVYHVVTENDGEHTIDFSYIQDFPSGGVHTITVGTGSIYDVYIDETTNTIRITSGTVINSGDLILNVNECPNVGQEC